MMNTEYRTLAIQGAVLAALITVLAGFMAAQSWYAASHPAAAAAGWQWALSLWCYWRYRKQI